MGNIIHRTQKQSHRTVDHRRVVIIVVLAGMLLVAVVAGSLYWWQSMRQDEAAIAEQRNKGLAESVPVLSSSEQEAVRLVREGLADGDEAKIAESGGALGELLTNAITEQDKETYLLALVDLYQNAGKYTEALRYATQLDELLQSSMSSARVADVYFSMENYRAAVQYYQQAVDRSTPIQDPTKDTPYNDYMNRKREAEERL